MCTCKPFIFLLPLLAGITAQAQQPAKDSIGQQNLQPVEIRSLRAGSEAPFAKIELSKQDLEKLNLGQDLPYLLQYTPSAVVTSDAGAGVGYTGLRIRGTDGTRINVTLNGIPVNDAESQGAFFVDFPDVASSAGSVQVQRGVGTSTNGAGAFGATISISTLDQMKRAGGSGSFSLGSFNTRKYTFKAGTGLLKNGLQFDVRLSGIGSDGYIDRSASRLRSLQLIAGWKISEQSSLRFLLMTGAEKTGQAWNGVPEDSLQTHRTYNELGKKTDGSFYDDQTDNYQQNYYQLFFDKRFGTRWTANVALFLTAGKGYYQEYKTGEAYSDYGLAPFVAGADTVRQTDLIRQLWLDNNHYGAVFSLLYEKPGTKISFGGGMARYEGNHFGYITWAQLNVPDNYRWYRLDAEKTDANLYLKAQHTVGKLILFGDLQARIVQYQINGFRKNPDLKPEANYTFFNPKVGITWMLRNTNAERQKAYLSFAVANKEPNRDDFEASPSSLPRPERLYDVEAGYEWNRRKWSVAANLYYMSYKDQLVLTGKINDVGAYTRTNVPASYRTGVELTAAARPASWLSLQGNATYAQNKIKDAVEYIDNWDDGTQQVVNHGNTDIAFSPALIAAGSFIIAPYQNEQHAQRLELEWHSKYVSRQYLDNTSNVARSIDPYSVSDLRLRYHFSLRPFNEVTATFAVLNVLDKKYESNGYTYSYINGGMLSALNYYYPQAGRNWMVGLTMNW